MDAETALYYVRSRYSTSDFHRADRQQDVLIAIKNRIISLGVLANPPKIFNFLDIIGRHVRTDLSLGEMKDLLKLVTKKEFEIIEQKVLDTSPEGFLYSSRTDYGAYILLPNNNDFGNIYKYTIHIFDEKE